MTDVDRTPKPCLHPRADHQHGTYACYILDYCRCLQCAHAGSVYEQNRKRRNAYGRSNLVDAGPVREHAATLMAAGIGLKRIVQMSGVPQGGLWKLMYGKRRPDGTTVPSKRVTKHTAERIFALDPADPSLLADGAPVPSVGTARRLQALACLGWSINRLTTESGIDRQVLDKALRGEQITARHVRAVAALYDRLWDRPAPARDHRERISVARTRNRAAAAGWLPPLAWDDDTIDDPSATPDAGDDEDVVDEMAVDAVCDGHSMPLSGATLLAALDRLTDAGHPITVIAERLRITERQVHRLRGRDTVTPRYRQRGVA